MVTSIYATKQDVEDIVGRVVGDIINNALQLISTRFDKIEERLDHVETRLGRFEDRLDSTKAVVDLHRVKIRQLKRKCA